jgi:hypothetical protein
MSEVWKYSSCACCYASSYHQTMAFSWLGADFIGQIHPPSFKGHRFVLVATDYFIKWTEAVPLKNMTHKEVIEFITKHIIHRFGIPQTLTTDQGTSFMFKEVRDFAKLYKIKMFKSSSYYAQDNGQVESSNKTLIKLIKKKLRIIQGGGMKFCLKLCGHIAYQDMVPLKLLPLSWCTVKKLCCPFK